MWLAASTATVYSGFCAVYDMISQAGVPTLLALVALGVPVVHLARGSASMA